MRGRGRHEPGGERADSRPETGGADTGFAGDDRTATGWSGGSEQRGDREGAHRGVGLSRILRRGALVVPLLLAVAGAGAEFRPAPLPPEAAWSGASERLALAPGAPWATPFEESGQVRSPSYDETMLWLRRLAAAAPEVSIVPIGHSHEGRELVFVIAAKDGAASPGELAASGRPTLLAQAGIHAGEIDGKDAAMMLLRDLTVGGTKRQLLEKASLVVLPIFNVDGHERTSPYGRMNQRGPAVMGWRTNARNLNLNRDYAKLDTPEVRALVAALNVWPVDLYLDLHVTDGADYQYDITYGWNEEHAWSPAIAGWLRKRLAPRLDAALTAAGHVPGPLVFQVDKKDPGAGIYLWTATPRYSNGYGDLRHLPTVLVENHSLKSFRRRVLGTYVLLQAALETLGGESEPLRDAVSRDRSRRPADPVLAFQTAEEEPRRIEFLGIEVDVQPSEVLAVDVPVYAGVPRRYEVPVVAATRPAITVRRPAAYWVPPSWPEVIARLALHGIRMERLDASREVAVELYRLVDPELAQQPFEGRVGVEAGTAIERRTVVFAPGSVRVPTDQPLGDLAISLLEPAAPDSFFRWGFFLEVLTRTEYAELYVLEPLARRMLAQDRSLADEFDQWLNADEERGGSWRERARFFHERTPYWDERYLLYPVAREP